MKVIDVYEQYFEGYAEANGVERHGAQVLLIATSEDGNIKYEIAVNFFPHTEEDPFAISYDAYTAKELYNAKGRRSKKREEAYLELLRGMADELAASVGGTIDWDRPLIEARRG